MERIKKKSKHNDDSKPIRCKVDLIIEPGNGKSTRQVIACLKGLDGKDVDFVDVLNVFKADAREKFVTRLAKESGHPKEELHHVAQSLVIAAKEVDQQQAEELARQLEEEIRGAEESASIKSVSEKILENTPSDIRAEAEGFLNDPKMFDRLDQDFQSLGITGERKLATMIYLAGASRLLLSPLAVCVKASSASGKSYVSSTVLSFFPPEDLISATDITPQSLYYMPPGSLRHKIVSVAERKHVTRGNKGAGADTTLAFREMISSGRLEKIVTIKGSSERIVQEGPIVYVETTTIEQIFDEDENRMLILATDESPDQTKSIMEQQAREAAGKVITEEEREQVRWVHQTAQRMLRPFRVRIPFAERLILPSSRINTRRAFHQFLGCIKAVALLRQRHKQEKDGEIAATWKDYKIAYGLMLPILKRTFSPVGERPMKLYKVICKKIVGNTFTKADCQNWAGVSASEAANRLRMLIDAGLIEKVAGKQGQRCVYRLLASDVAEESVTIEGLVTPAQLRAALEDTTVDANDGDDGDGSCDVPNTGGYMDAPEADETDDDETEDYEDEPNYDDLVAAESMIGNP